MTDMLHVCAAGDLFIFNNGDGPMRTVPAVEERLISSVILPAPLPCHSKISCYHK